MPHQVSGRHDAPRFINLFSDFTPYLRARRFRSPCGLGALNRLFLPRAARPGTRLAAGIRRELEGDASVPEPAQAGARRPVTARLWKSGKHHGVKRHSAATPSEKDGR